MANVKTEETSKNAAMTIVDMPDTGTIVPMAPPTYREGEGPSDDAGRIADYPMGVYDLRAAKVKAATKVAVEILREAARRRGLLPKAK